MPAGLDAVTSRFESDQPHVWIIDERMEDPDGVGSPADARRDRVGQPAGLGLDLNAGLQADDALKITHHGREGMRSGGGAEAVVRGGGGGGPNPGTLNWWRPWAFGSRCRPRRPRRPAAASGRR